jgi:pyruvate/2-oxoglutarate dehydrogenase complex dihydrolipoamide acyltransferase (E2) component
VLFVGALVDKVKSLNINSGISDDPSAIRTHWNRVIGWMTTESFKLKSLSEQVQNEFIKDAELRLQERLAREAEERARKEAEEKARQEEMQRIKEAEAKALAEAAAAEAEAKAAAEAEAHLAEESATRVEPDALTQGESSTFVPLVLKTLEDLQKEQKEVRARLDQQDSVNVNIQNLLTQLLQRMPPPPNP